MELIATLLAQILETDSQELMSQSTQINGSMLLEQKMAIFLMLKGL